MDSLIYLLSCFKWLVLNNGQLEFIFVMFRAVSPKQWTAWVYLLSCFRWLVLNNEQLEFTFHFPKSVIPCFIRKRDVTQIFRIITKNFIPRFVGSRNIKQISFPVLSDHGISSKFHSPFCRITEYQANFIPRFVGSRNIKQISFPALSDYGISNFIPRFVGLRNIKKRLSLVCRITEGHSSSIFLTMPSPVCLVERCH